MCMKGEWMSFYENIRRIAPQWIAIKTKLEESTKEDLQAQSDTVQMFLGRNHFQD